MESASPRDDAPVPDITQQLCGHCGGDGKIWTSRYGGNDPDVWPIGNCPACEGYGYELIETEEVTEEEVMANGRP